VRASERRNRLRKPAANRATLTPDPSPGERARGDYGRDSKHEDLPTLIGDSPKLRTLASWVYVKTGCASMPIEALN